MGKIRMIIMDLDGVLVDSKDMHFEALNEALAYESDAYVISKQEHQCVYDGLPTRTKLEMLHTEKKLPRASFEAVWIRKQDLFAKKLIESVTPNPDLIALLHALRSKDIELRCCSNSIYLTVRSVLEKLDILDFFSAIYGNDMSSVSMKSNRPYNNIKPKPSPSVFLLATIDSGFSPNQVMICEDSRVGRQAAIASGCFLCPMENASCCTEQTIFAHLKHFESEKIAQSVPYIMHPEMNVVIPMAGMGSRFAKAGFADIKPMIEVKPGLTMIQTVVENLNIKAKHVLIAQKAHIDAYRMDKWLPTVFSNRSITIVPVAELTKGAACTVLLAKDLINNDKPLLLANSDQFIEWDNQAFFHKMDSDPAIDGGILTFRSDRTCWSYAKIDEHGIVQEVAEKKVISPFATVGIYYFKRGCDFVRFAEEMIQCDSNKVNGEFYIAPIFNTAIANGLRFITHECEKMHGLGTPEDLAAFQLFCGS